VFDWYTRNRMHNPKVKLLKSFGFMNISFSVTLELLSSRQDNQLL
jgi:hypothetical protein